LRWLCDHWRVCQWLGVDNSSCWLSVSSDWFLIDYCCYRLTMVVLFDWLGGKDSNSWFIRLDDWLWLMILDNWFLVYE
jgi:hypothetical protein